MSKRVAKKDNKDATKDAKTAVKVDLDAEVKNNAKDDETGVMPVD
jgi:hypothetical protein